MTLASSYFDNGFAASFPQSRSIKESLPVSKKSLNSINCMDCKVRAKSIFCTLDYEGVLDLNDNKEGNLFKKGQTIFHEGSRPRGLYCVFAGKVKISKTGDEGKEQIVHLAKEGDVLGYRAILSGENYSCSAVALEDSLLCYIPRSHFFEMVEKDPSISMRIIRLLSQELRVAEKNITDLAQKPVRERLAESLLFIRETYGFEADGKTLNVSLTREEIANVVGTATESAIRLLSEFKNDGLIELDGKKIKLLDMKRLIRTANILD